MARSDFERLKSGSDVRGTAIERTAGEGIALTDEAVGAIVRAFCVWFSQKYGKKELTIAVGHDSRLSADRLTDCTAKALAASGATALCIGLCSTPAMYMILLEEDIGADASIMITASHLPYYMNGLKFFTRDGGLEGKDISAILALAAEGRSLTGKGAVRQTEYMSRYCDGLVRLVRGKTGNERPLSGKKIAVDAGNGAGGFYAQKVLGPLGADISACQFLEPDGHFPNHIPNPENEEAMRSLSGRVRETKADFGIIFDTDVDRAACVDKEGKEINRNRLIALVAAILLEETPGATVVTDSVTSAGLTKFIAARGGTHCRYKRGYKNVIDKAKELNAAGVYAPLAIETSGHAALKENYFLDDGAYLMTRILVTLAKLAAEGKEISDLIADLPEPADSAEVRLGFTEAGKADFKAKGNAAIEDIKQRVPALAGMALAPDNYEGVRIDFDTEHGNGWALIRMSLHEPIVPVNFESDSAGGGLAIAKELLALLAPYAADIDLTNLKNYIENHKGDRQ